MDSTKLKKKKDDKSSINDKSNDRFNIVGDALKIIKKISKFIGLYKIISMFDFFTHLNILSLYLFTTV